MNLHGNHRILAQLAQLGGTIRVGSITLGCLPIGDSTTRYGSPRWPPWRPRGIVAARLPVEAGDPRPEQPDAEEGHQEADRQDCQSAAELACDVPGHGRNRRPGSDPGEQPAEQQEKPGPQTPGRRASSVKGIEQRVVRLRAGLLGPMRLHRPDALEQRQSEPQRQRQDRKRPEEQEAGRRMVLGQKVGRQKGEVVETMEEQGNRQRLGRVKAALGRQEMIQRQEVPHDGAVHRMGGHGRHGPHRGHADSAFGDVQ